MKKIYFRTVATLAIPFVIAFVTLRRVWAETKDIPFYVRCDVSEEIEAYKEIMKTGDRI